MEAVLDGVLEVAVEPPGGRGGLAPDEVLGEEEPLLPKPEDQFVLEDPALRPGSPGAVVEHEAAVRSQHPVHLGGEFEEETLVPVAAVGPAVPVLALPVVWWRGDDEVDTLGGKPRHDVERVGHEQRPQFRPVGGHRPQVVPRKLMHGRTLPPAPRASPGFARPHFLAFLALQGRRNGALSYWGSGRCRASLCVRAPLGAKRRGSGPWSVKWAESPAPSAR